MSSGDPPLACLAHLQSHTSLLLPPLRFGLAVVNPLLGSAVAVQPMASHLAPAAAPGGSGLRGDPQAVRMQLYPDGMQLPYRGGVIVVQPLALTLAAGGPLQELCAGRLGPAGTPRLTAQAVCLG